MKNSFTLIEVIISTLIVFIVTFAIVNFNNNTKKIFNILVDNNLFMLYSTIPLYNHNGKNIYEDLIDFKINNDEIIKTLKTYKINYKVYLNTENKLDNTQLYEQLQQIILKNKLHRVSVYKVDVK